MNESEKLVHLPVCGVVVGTSEEAVIRQKEAANGERKTEREKSYIRSG